MTLMIASADIVSIFFMLVILGSLRNKAETEEGVQRLFRALVICTILGLFFDAFSYIADATQSTPVILCFVNVMAFSMIYGCIVLFSFYIVFVIRRTKRISFLFGYLILTFSVLNILWIIAGVCTGKFFSVRDNHLSYGPWQDIITVMPVACVIAITVMLIVYAKSMGKRTTLVLSSFAAFPLNAAILLIFFPTLQLAYIATALSCAVIYTYIRREEINDAHIREQVMSELSVKDPLTGLLNRRGFNEVTERAGNHESLAIVFSDLNALKSVNDNYGHVAGDKYIQKYADILKRVFKDMGSICRISGDEFVVILFDIASEEFDGFKKRLSSAINANDRIASVGYANGDGASANELMRLAEQEMYDDKNRYYKETGRDRRRGGY